MATWVIAFTGLVTTMIMQLGEYFTTLWVTSVIMSILVSSSSSRLIPGFLPRPEVMITISELAVDEAGSNPCPPVIVGVGIGGTVEKTVMLAKRALLRKIGESNPDAEVAELEKE
ncbi:unnamed protein product, partial [marine sediment metagenome]